MTTQLIDVTSETYLRRLVRECNRTANKHGPYASVQPAREDSPRIKVSRTFLYNGHLAARAVGGGNYTINPNTIEDGYGRSVCASRA